MPYARRPKLDAALLVENEIEILVSVNGKMRDVIKVAVDADNATIEALAKIVQRWLQEQRIKTIYIEPGSP